METNNSNLNGPAANLTPHSTDRDFLKAVVKSTPAVCRVTYCRNTSGKARVHQSRVVVEQGSNEGREKADQVQEKLVAAAQSQSLSQT